MSIEQTAAQSKIKLPATPALDLELFGMHLIEASAGTGKTWALSALIVRLLVTDKTMQPVSAVSFSHSK